MPDWRELGPGEVFEQGAGWTDAERLVDENLDSRRSARASPVLAHELPHLFVAWPSLAEPFRPSTHLSRDLGGAVGAVCEPLDLFADLQRDPRRELHDSHRARADADDRAESVPTSELVTVCY